MKTAHPAALPAPFPETTVHERVRAAFQAGLALVPGLESRLAGALRQTLDHPGNMVRARLVYQISLAYGMAEAPALNLAVAMEYFHTASLLFDDLPCMDDAEERRGVACVHRVHGESAAMLAALALINRAYALLWTAIHEAPPETRLRATRLVETCLGLGGVLNGQSLDLHDPGRVRSGRQVMTVAMGKTVALIRMTLVLPALLGGAGPVELRLLQRLAVFWGLSYQMLDDLKDLFETSDATGKTGRRDASLNRPNLALAEGALRTLARLRRLVRLADGVLARLGHGPINWTFLGELRNRLAGELQQFANLPRTQALS